jgi:hypothetical protein
MRIFYQNHAGIASGKLLLDGLVGDSGRDDILSGSACQERANESGGDEYAMDDPQINLGAKYF